MSIDGTYRITAETRIGNMEGTLTLITEGEELRGTMSGSLLGTIDFSGGKIEGSRFSFAMTMKKFFKKIEVAGAGKVDGDQISGEVKTSLGNSSFAGTRI
ncbi:MAG: hypothetical protein JXL81_02305 [Deltaproteobacteria bacterium]|nr:hypothetical protein [Deltaproteobacteria bacterium]